MNNIVLISITYYLFAILLIILVLNVIQYFTKKKYKNPIGIIGRNDGDVLEKYSSIKNKEGFVFAELVHNCSELKVEPK